MRKKVLSPGTQSRLTPRQLDSFPRQFRLRVIDHSNFSAIRRGRHLTPRVGVEIRWVHWVVDYPGWTRGKSGMTRWWGGIMRRRCSPTIIRPICTMMLWYILKIKQLSYKNMGLILSQNLLQLFFYWLWVCYWLCQRTTATDTSHTFTIVAD